MPCYHLALHFIREWNCAVSIKAPNNFYWPLVDGISNVSWDNNKGNGWEEIKTVTKFNVSPTHSSVLCLLIRMYRQIKQHWYAECTTTALIRFTKRKKWYSFILSKVFHRCICFFSRFCVWTFKAFIEQHYFNKMQIS